MKHFLLSVALIATTATALAATPEEVSYIFKDNQTSGISTKAYVTGTLESTYYSSKYGLKNGWTVTNITDENAEIASGVPAYVSCSRLASKESPENWLILPTIKVQEGAILEWTAKSIYNTLRDSYSIYISEGGQNKEDFKLLYKVDKEEYFFTRHILSLNEYAGKEVTIAFVHSDAEGYMLALAEIFAGQTNRGFNAKNIGSHFFGRNDEQSADFIITNYGGKFGTELSRFELVNADNDTEVFAIAVPEEIAGVTENFTISFPLEFSVGSFVNYILKAVYENGESDILMNDFINISEFKRKVFIEKYTATWCNNCPAVSFVTHYYLSRLGDDCVYLEPHVPNLSGSDMMAINGYMDAYQYSLGGDFPAVWINRSFKQSSTSVRDRSCFDKAIKEPCNASIKLDLISYDYKKIKAKATVISSETLDNTDGFYRVAFSVAQKHVPLNPIAFPQTNRVSGMSSLVNGEYNFLPGTLPKESTIFENVVIGPVNGFCGEDGSLPETIEAGKEYIVNFEYDIPEDCNPENLMLVTNFNYHKENKGGVPFPALNVDNCDLQFKDGVGVMGIDEIANNKPKYFVNGNNIEINLPESENYNIDFFSTVGNIVYQVSGSGNTLTVPADILPNGIVICSISQNNSKYSLKIIK